MKLRLDYRNKRHIYEGKYVEEMTKEELINAFNEACNCLTSTHGKQAWLAIHAPYAQSIIAEAERKNRWKQIICYFMDHEWIHFWGNEFICHRCKKIRIRL